MDDGNFLIGTQRGLAVTQDALGKRGRVTEFLVKIIIIAACLVAVVHIGHHAAVTRHVGAAATFFITDIFTTTAIIVTTRTTTVIIAARTTTAVVVSTRATTAVIITTRTAAIFSAHLVEVALAALIGANIAPGVYRDHYAFQQWPDYDADLFEKVYNDDSAEREFTHKIYGSDIEGKAIAIARANVKNAGLNKYIELERRDFNDIELVPEGGTLISNPPYGERLNVEDIEELYREMGFKFKHTFKGYNIWLICNNEELHYKVGLKPSVRYKLNNGGLDCELLQYVIFD